MFQNVLRGAITVLVLAIGGLSLLGIFWWNEPPEKLTGYERGGQFILGTLILCSLCGLIVLWRAPRPADS